MKVGVIPIVIGALGTIPKDLVNGLENKNQRTSGDYSNYRIIKIGQNTEESPEDLMRLAVTQTPVRDFQLTLVRKIL